MIKLSIFRQKPFKTISDCYFFSLERLVFYVENTYAILQRLFEPKELIVKKCNFWPNKPQVSPFEKKINFLAVSYRYFSSQERFVFSFEYTYAFILNPFGPKERIEKNCKFWPKAWVSPFRKIQFFYYLKQSKIRVNHGSWGNPWFGQIFY